MYPCILFILLNALVGIGVLEVLELKSKPTSLMCLQQKTTRQLQLCICLAFERKSRKQQSEVLSVLFCDKQQVQRAQLFSESCFCVFVLSWSRNIYFHLRERIEWTKHNGGMIIGEDFTIFRTISETVWRHSLQKPFSPKIIEDQNELPEEAILSKEAKWRHVPSSLLLMNTAVSGIFLRMSGAKNVLWHLLSFSIQQTTDQRQ